MGLLPFDAPESPSTRPEPLSVTQVSRLIVQALAEGTPSSVRIQGEIGSLAIRNGHWFFSLRDKESSLDAVMWASQARVNRHRPEEGESVIVSGRIGHWPRGGRTRLEARRVEPDGAGDLRAAFLRLCAELRDLGWFDAEHKKLLPDWPGRVGVVTSAQGAAVTDVVATARSRFPSTDLLVVDVRVQGDAAAAEVSTAIGRLDRLGLDAIIVTRGGGSAEDLEAFNDRRVAEAVFQARTPIVAAIGHESDTTIIELVADVRASTPTHAVTLLLPDQEDVHARFEALRHRLDQASWRVVRRQVDRLSVAPARLNRAVRGRLDRLEMMTESLATRLTAARPDRVIPVRRRQLQVFQERLQSAMERHLRSRLQPAEVHQRLRQGMARLLRGRREHVESLGRALSAVDPLAVLERGYSITTDAQGRAVRSSKTVAEGDELMTRVAAGTIRSRVEIAEAAQGDSDTVGS
ncbi:MAG: exodeoxyribonuclease VII large subunit [Phycisphaerales bacterium]|nr:exodeoxyribonuclease VII large subunit [Phycisphaerales bacterium]